jgi:hypothetical protein
VEEAWAHSSCWAVPPCASPPFSTTPSTSRSKGWKEGKYGKWTYKRVKRRRSNNKKHQRVFGIFCDIIRYFFSILFLSIRVLFRILYIFIFPYQLFSSLF